MGGECRKGGKKQPTIFHTDWGWSMYGHNRSDGDEVISSFQIEVDDSELKEEINRVFSRDFEDIILNKKNLSREDYHALEQFEMTIEFKDSDKHWTVGLPWKGSRRDAARILNSVDSSKAALNRLKKSMVKIRADPDMLKNIADQMDDMIKEGYVRRVDPSEELDKREIPCWVMPTVFDKKQGNKGT